MKLLLLTVSDQQRNPLHKYADLHRTFDFKCWEQGFRSISPDAQFFDYYAGFVSRGPIAMESSIRDLVRQHNVQLLIVPNIYYEIAPTFLNELRKIGCRSMIVFFDDSLRFQDTNRFYLSAFDYYLTHESVYSKELYRPYGIQPEFFPHFPSCLLFNKITGNLDRKASVTARDVVFVGARIADRSLFIDCLKDNGIDIGVHGIGWDAGMLSTEEMIATYNSSKICLNFVKAIDGSGRIQLKGRLFEIAMAGGFVLSEHCDELRNYFDIGREIDTFASPEELLDKVRFYLERDDLRLEMSARARNLTQTNYSLEYNWSRHLQAIERGSIRSQYPNPGYVVPSSAQRAFLRWNLPIIFGRCMLHQFGLAYQQYKFCRRELEECAAGISVAKAFGKWTIRRLLRDLFRNINGQ